MRNAWVTDEGAAATQALNQEAGDVHAPSLREKTTSATTPHLAPRLFSRHRDVGDMAPSIVVHHERSAAAGPGSASVTPEPVPKIDSTTMIDPGVSTPTTPNRAPSGTWPAPRMQQSFNQSAQVRPCSSQVLEAEEVTHPPVLEELTDDVFVPQPSSAPPTSPPQPSPPQSPPPQPSPRPSRTSPTSTTTPSSTSATASSATDTTPETDSGAEDRHGMKRPVSTSDSSDSQAHRTLVRGPSKYPKRLGRSHPLVVIPPEDQRGQKRMDASSDTSYSQEHRTTNAGPSNYPKRPNRPRVVVSSEEDEQLPRQRRPRSRDSDYSREHRATAKDGHRYPK